MIRIKIVLDTKTQLNDFVTICGEIENPVYLSDGNNEYRVSAKSTLGCIMAKMEWDDIYCEYSEEDASTLENKLRVANLLAE